MGGCTLMSEWMERWAFINRLAGNGRVRKKNATGLRRNAPLVPIDSSSGRALSAVIAILTFLAALCAVGAELVAASSQEWQSSVSREVTVQVRPLSNRNIEEDVIQAADLIRSLPGIENVIVFSRAESEKLLEPWLGSALNMKELPIPRLIVVKLLDNPRPDFDSLREAFRIHVPNASLDDHNLWLGRLAAMANTVVMIGIAIVLLVLNAAGLAVTFATRGAMVGNKEVVEVLHFVGANDSYIATEFQRRFFQLGLRGSLYGSCSALIFCMILGLLFRSIRATASGAQIEAMFGIFGVSWRGVAIVLVISVLVAGITGVVSRLTVRKYLKATAL